MEIFCQCGKSWSGDDIVACPWERLEVAGRLRCWDCGRALAAAKDANGKETPAQELPPTSLGALKKLPERPALKEHVGGSGTLDWE